MKLNNFISRTYFLAIVSTFLIVSESRGQFKNWSNCFNNNYDIKFNRSGSKIVSCKDTIELSASYKGSGLTVYWADGYVGQTRTIYYSGYYQVAVIEDSSYCIDTSDWIYVEVNNLKNTVYIEGGYQEATICEGSTIKLNCYSSDFLFPSNGIRWNTGDTTASITVSAAGKYYVVQKTKNNCNDTSNVVKVNVVKLKKPLIKALTDTALCKGDTVKLECYQYEGKLVWLPYYTTSPKVSATEDGDYYVFAQDSLSGCYYYSNRISVRFKKPIAAQLCMVTVDSATGKNKLVWKNQGEPATKYIVYREGSVAFAYNDLGEVSNNGGLMQFIDSTSIPKSRPYSYYIAAVDSCGNVAEESKYYAHTTLHLTASLGVNGENNLNWGDYLGIYPISTYLIYRSNKNGAFVQLAQVASTVKSYSDLDPPSGGNRYYIGINAGSTCSSSSGNSSINSNMVAFGILNSEDFAIGSIKAFPNPTQDKVNISGLESRDYPISIHQTTGAVVKTGVVSSSNATIPVSDLAPGLYFLRFENGASLPIQVIRP